MINAKIRNLESRYLEIIWLGEIYLGLNDSDLYERLNSSIQNKLGEATPWNNFKTSSSPNYTVTQDFLES
jgi:hypothetical protein